VVHVSSCPRFLSLFSFLFFFRFLLLYLFILSRVELCVTYRRVLDWISDLLTAYTHHSELHSAIADLHTLQFTVTHALGFSVFTSRVLATDLKQSHCHFKSNVKSSLHSLIPFLPFLPNHGNVFASPSIGLFAKNLSPREHVYRAVA
jgi:hypothetical protein